MMMSMMIVMMVMIMMRMMTIQFCYTFNFPSLTGQYGTKYNPFKCVSHPLHRYHDDDMRKLCGLLTRLAE